MALPAKLHERLKEECARLALAERQLAKPEKVMVRQLPQAVQERIVELRMFKGIGDIGAMRLLLKLYWRDFHNR